MQHEFRKGRSCLINLQEFFEDIMSAVDRGEQMKVIYLDFQRQSIRCNIKDLSIRMHRVGVDVLARIEDWLTNRKHRVGIHGYFSGWQSVVSSVPPGSVLGPQLFMIYINDLEDGVVNWISRYADDRWRCG